MHTADVEAAIKFGGLAAVKSVRIQVDRHRCSDILRISRVANCPDHFNAWACRIFLIQSKQKRGNAALNT